MENVADEAYTMLADFSNFYTDALPAGFDPEAVTYEKQPNGVWLVSYTVTGTNMEIDGTYNVVLLATDVSGNETTYNYPVVLDNTLPVVTITETAADYTTEMVDGVYNFSSVIYAKVNVVDANATDEVSDLTFTLKTGETVLGVIANGANEMIRWNGTDYELEFKLDPTDVNAQNLYDTAAVITVEVKDMALNIGTDDEEITIDTTGPVFIAETKFFTDATYTVELTPPCAYQ